MKKILYIILLLCSFQNAFCKNVKFIYEDNNGNENIFCRGIFISANIISAPAHCIKKAQSLKKTINFICYLTTEDNEKIKIKKVLIHKEYNNIFLDLFTQHDASLIVTTNNYNYESNINQNDFLDGVDIKIDNNKISNKLIKVTDSEIFMLQEEKCTINNGDSGKPLYIDDQLAGLISRKSNDKCSFIITRIKDFFNILDQYDENEN